MGFIRTLHVVSARCTYPNVLFENDIYGARICYGKYGFEFVLPDLDDVHFGTIMQGVMVWFKNPSKIDLDQIKKSLDTELGYSLINALDGIMLYIRDNTGRVLLRGLTIFGAPDNIILDVIKNPSTDYVYGLLSDWIGVHSEYDFAPREEMEEWCRSNACRDITNEISRLRDELERAEREGDYEKADEISREIDFMEGDLSECIIDCMKTRLPKELRQPRPRSLYAVIAGEIYEGCKAFDYIKKLLPEFDYAYWRSRCT